MGMEDAVASVFAQHQSLGLVFKGVRRRLFAYVADMQHLFRLVFFLLNDDKLSFAARHFEQEKDQDRKSTRLNSSHHIISYPFFSFKKKKLHPIITPHSLSLPK